MKKDVSKNSNGKYKIVLLSAVIEMVVTALFIFVSGIIMYLTEMGSDYAPVFATASVALGCIASAFYTAKVIKSRGFLVGIIIGGVTFITVTLISLIIDKGTPGINTLFHFIIYMLSSLIGGIVGVNKATNKKYI